MAPVTTRASNAMNAALPIFDTFFSVYVRIVKIVTLPTQNDEEIARKSLTTVVMRDEGALRGLAISSGSIDLPVCSYSTAPCSRSRVTVLL